MKILVIMLYWYPYEGPLMPIYRSIFKELLKKGHRVTVVTSFPHYRKGRKETWDEYRGKFYEIQNWEGIKLIRSYVFAPVFKSDKFVLIWRALNYISFNFSSLLGAIFLSGRQDIILAASSPPLTNGIVSYIVGLLKGCPIIYNVQDLYPDMAAKLRLVRSKHILRLLYTLEKLVYTCSTRVLAISESIQKVITDKGIPKDKIEVIENFIDADRVIPGSSDNLFSRKYNLDNKYVVMYAGNIGFPHGVEVLVHAAELMLSETDIVFCFVSRGENKENVESLARRKGLFNSVFIDPQPEEMVPLIWASASVGVITYRKGLADFSVPSKLLAMMCAARPAIASLDDNCEAARIIRKSGCGVVVPPEDEKSLCKVIIELKNNSEMANKMGLRGRKYVEQHFQRQVISDRYEKLFLCLTKSQQI